MIKFNKLNLILHFSITLLAIYVSYLQFFRYLLADTEIIAIAMLNPNQLPTAQPGLFSLVMLVVIFVGFLLIRVKASSHSIFRLMKGMYGYSLGFLVLQLAITLGRDTLPEDWTKAVYESKHLFVEVLADNTRLRESPSLDAKILTTVNTGTLLLLNDVKKTDTHTWNRVLLAPREYGWIVRVAKVDQQSTKRLSKTNKFYFTRADQYSLVVALLGFLWGFLSYKKS